MKKRIEGIVLFLLLSFVGFLAFASWEDWKIRQELRIKSLELDIKYMRLLQEENLYYDRARESIEPFPERLPDDRKPWSLYNISLYS